MTQSDLVIYNQNNVYFDETGMHAPDHLSYPEWEEIGCNLGAVNRRSNLAFMWGWGDWLNYGERKYGEAYSQALEITGLAPGTLANYKWVVSRIPKELRGLPNLAQEHYVKVARISDPEIQKDLLILASKHGWAAWYKSVKGHLDDYKIDDLQFLYNAAVARLSEKRLSFSRPGSLTKTLPDIAMDNSLAIEGVSGKY